MANLAKMPRALFDEVIWNEFEAVALKELNDILCTVNKFVGPRPLVVH